MAFDEERNKRLIKEFNIKPKTAINKLKTPKEIVNFLFENKNSLDLEAIGDYLGAEENTNIRNQYVSKMDFSNQEFLPAFRTFLLSFKLPGEAQKIDRLVESFSLQYSRQNPQSSFKSSDAIYLLAFQSIMLNVDLHNPNIPQENKMDLQGLTKNLRGVNQQADFSSELLKDIYEGIKKTPFKVNFTKVDPGYVIKSGGLNQDEIFAKLGSFLQSKSETRFSFFQSKDIIIQDIFPFLNEDNIQSRVHIPKSKSCLPRLTGYQGIITLLNSQNDELVTIQIYKPNMFSRFFFSEKSKLIIQPTLKENDESYSLKLAAKIAARTNIQLDSIKANYDYLKQDLESAYDAAKEATNAVIIDGAKHLK